MKITDITPGAQYAYNPRPRARWSSVQPVYVLGITPVAGYAYFVDEAEGDEAFREYVSPIDGSTLRVPERSFSRWSGNRGKGVLIGRYVTDDKRYRYVTDENGNNVEDENGNWIEAEPEILPPYWQFAVEKAETIRQTWADYEAAIERGKATQARLDAQRAEEAARQAEKAEQARVERETLAKAVADDLATRYGITFADILGEEAAVRYAEGRGTGTDAEKVAVALTVLALADRNRGYA